MLGHVVCVLYLFVGRGDMVLWCGLCVAGKVGYVVCDLTEFVHVLGILCDICKRLNCMWLYCCFCKWASEEM